MEEEFQEIEKNKGWNLTLQDIKRKAEANAREHKFTVTEAKKITNVKLNRYNDVVPYDHSRVQLHRKGFDYVNANIVRCEHANRRYILCQGPLPGTVQHFWLMVWEQNSQAILMLNKLVEERHIKCHLYWPEKAGDIMEMAEVGLTVEYLRVANYTNFCKRTFKLTDAESTKSREVVQFHYTKWPDFGIPQTPIAFLKFLKHVRAEGVLEENVGPAIVHCSAGIGRSGTFCLVDSCLIIVDKYGEDKLSVREVLLELRKYRMGLIQTGDQLYFSYLAVIEGKKYLKNHTLDQLDDEQIADGDEAGHDPITDDNEEPPPLPARTHSLTTQKLEDGTEEPRIHHNIESTTTTFTNRPLPPLPVANCNSHVYPSTGPGDSSDSDEPEEEISSLDTTDEENEEELGIDDVEENSDRDVPEIQRDDSSLSSPTNEGNSDVRRRKRLERREAMEEKIQQIKRKTREVEEGAIIAKKRRQNSRAK